jgi:uncharacterized DUF497 family protein
MKTVFEWDPRKARANYRKHRVSFHEAASVFDDPLADIYDDEDHSNGGTREIILGHSARARLLLVSFAERAPNRIRIISARSANRRERDEYERDKKT